MSSIEITVTGVELIVIVICLTTLIVGLVVSGGILTAQSVGVKLLDKWLQRQERTSQR